MRTALVEIAAKARRAAEAASPLSSPSPAFAHQLNPLHPLRLKAVPRLGLRVLARFPDPVVHQQFLPRTVIARFREKKTLGGALINPVQVSPTPPARGARHCGSGARSAREGKE